MSTIETETAGRFRAQWRITKVIRKALRIAAIEAETTQEDLVERVLTDHLTARGFLPPPSAESVTTPHQPDARSPRMKGPRA